MAVAGVARGVFWAARFMRSSGRLAFFVLFGWMKVVEASPLILRFSHNRSAKSSNSGTTLSNLEGIRTNRAKCLKPGLYCNSQPCDASSLSRAHAASPGRAGTIPFPGQVALLTAF